MKNLQQEKQQIDQTVLAKLENNFISQETLVKTSSQELEECPQYNCDIKNIIEQGIKVCQQELDFYPIELISKEAKLLDKLFKTKKYTKTWGIYLYLSGQITQDFEVIISPCHNPLNPYYDLSLLRNNQLVISKYYTEAVGVVSIEKLDIDMVFVDWRYSLSKEPKKNCYYPNQLQLITINHTKCG